MTRQEKRRKAKNEAKKLTLENENSILKSKVDKYWKAINKMSTAYHELSAKYEELLKTTAKKEEVVELRTISSK